MRRCPACGTTYRGVPAKCPLDGTSLVDVTDDNTGRRLGDWTLRATIAEGPLATVYRAERDGVAAALKLYRLSDSLRRAWREGDALGRVTHLNVAALLDRGLSEDGAVFVVTELVHGQTLREILAGSPGLPWSEAARIASEVAAGLEAIHGQGLVHRDIKPSNLMLADGELVKILDLGHALALDLGRLTESGLVWGSAPYMSPEQAAGHPLDRRSDLYSLGVVLYEMLTGRRPFEARAAVDVMQMHWTHTPPHPSSCRPARGEGGQGPVEAIDARLGDLCMWLLARRPKARASSARTVRAILEGIMASGPSRARAAAVRAPTGAGGLTHTTMEGTDVY